MRAVQDLANLVLSRACVGCQTWGMPLCADCLIDARIGRGRERRFAWGTGYAGIGRAAVLAHKRQQVRALAGALGTLLADAVTELVPRPDSITLVPIPSHRRTRISRGQDTVRAIANAGARQLAQHGYMVAVHAVLTRTDERPSLAGANRSERQALLRGAFTCNPAALRRAPAHPMIVVDDVITTGATMREALRVLPPDRVLGCAAVARVPLAASRTERAPSRAARR